jgi:hypothetical protein
MELKANLNPSFEIQIYNLISHLIDTGAEKLEEALKRFGVSKNIEQPEKQLAELKGVDNSIKQNAIQLKPSKLHSFFRENYFRLYASPSKNINLISPQIPYQLRKSEDQKIFDLFSSSYTFSITI